MKTRAVALLLFIGLAAFYTFTLQPSIAWGDGIRLQHEVVSGESFVLTEMVDAEFAPDPFPFNRLGVFAWDHPLYIVTGNLLIHLLPGLPPLWLTNWLSALFGAAAIAVFFLLCYTNTNSYAAALLAAVALAVSHTFWWHAVTPEVYTLFAFLLLSTIYFFDRYERSGSLASLLASAFCLGLGIANHLLAGLAVPAAALYLLLSPSGQRPPWPRGRQWLWLALAFLLGFALYLVQLGRMLRTFPVARLLGPAIGMTFLRGSLATTPAELGQSVLTYLLYLFFQFGIVGLLLGLYGWATGARHYPRLWRKAIAFFVIYLLFGLIYQVTDQFAFFLAAHVFWAIAISMGVARLLAGRAPRPRRLITAGLALLILVMPLLYMTAPSAARALGVTDDLLGIPIIGNDVRDGLAYYVNPNKRGDLAADVFGRETLAQLPPDSLVIAQFFNDTDEYFIFRYLLRVEQMRPDVGLVGWPLEEPFAFDSDLVAQKIATELPERPVYLVSMSDKFYGTAALVERYCVAEEFNLYRVYSSAQAPGRDCLDASSVTE